MNRFKTLLAGALLASVASVPAFATTFLPGTWQVDTVVTSTGAHWNTMHVCLTSSGDWYMIDQFSGIGHWEQTGDYDVHWRGNIDAYNDSAELKIKGPKLMVGPYQQWRDGSADTGVVAGNLSATSTWHFVSKTCAAPFGGT